MKYQTDITADFEVEYTVTRPRQPARADEPACGPEFEITSCVLDVAGARVAIDIDDLPSAVLEALKDEVVAEIDAGD